MKSLQIKQTSYGHWYVSFDYRNRVIGATTTNSVAIDDYKSDPCEKDGRELRKKRGYTALYNEVVRNNYK
jgi:hypothetical protein